MKTIAKLGKIRCATIVCSDSHKAAALYEKALGYERLEAGHISEALAVSWGAEKMAGARFVVLGPQSGAACHLRFVEDATAHTPTPYLNTGWTALEFTVKSSDAAIERLRENGFTVLGEAEDLDFADGALRAGQVSGPHGEVLYLTQINEQLDDYVLPHATCDVDKLFIVILAVNNVDETMQHFNKRHGTPLKDTFEAAVPFIANYHGIDTENEFYVGTVELEEENYIEIDGMPKSDGPRPCKEGYLPAGIAMMTFEVEAIAPFQPAAHGAVTGSSALPYNNQDSMVFTGLNGEWIEVVEALS